MCAKLGVGTQFSAPYAHHMLGLTERPWCTIRVGVLALFYGMSVPMFMWSCAMSTVMHVASFIRHVGTSGGGPLTLITPAFPKALALRAFGCAIYTEVRDAQRKKLIRNHFVVCPYDVRLIPTFP
jgi:hypothetical protein